MTIEKQRKALGRIVKFEPYSAFQRIDRNRNGFIDSMDVLKFLRDNEFNEETEADTYYLLKFFDVDEDEKLNYTEFLTMVLPWDSSKLREEVTQRPNYYVGLNDYLSKSIEYEIWKLFVKEIAFHRRTEKIKQHLAVWGDFDNEAGFKAIDDWGYRYIDFSNLKRFLKCCGYIPTNKELSSIIRRLDLNADSRLSFDEFSEGISPIEPYSKIVISPQTNKIKTKEKTKRPKTATLTKNKTKKTKGITKVLNSPSRNKQSIQIESPNKKSPMRTYHDVDEEEKVYIKESPHRTTDMYSSRSPGRVGTHFWRECSPLKGRNFESPHKVPGRTQTSNHFFKYDTMSPRSPPRGYPVNEETLRHNEEKELVIALNDLLMMENDLENQKINLSIKPDFNLIDLFRMFDIEGKGYITFEEFRSGLSLFRLYPNTDDSFLMFTRFDNLKEEILRYSQFWDIFCPKTEEYWASLSTRQSYYIHKPYYRIGEYFHPETRASLECLLADSLRVESMAETIRQHLSIIPTFNIMEAFNTWDMINEGFITTKQLKLLLESHGFIADSQQITHLVDRFDKNKDGKISYGEFADEIRPRSPVRRIGF